MIVDDNMIIFYSTLCRPLPPTSSPMHSDCLSFCLSLPPTLPNSKQQQQNNTFSFSIHITGCLQSLCHSSAQELSCRSQINCFCCFCDAQSNRLCSPLLQCAGVTVWLAPLQRPRRRLQLIFIWAANPSQTGLNSRVCIWLYVYSDSRLYNLYCVCFCYYFCLLVSPWYNRTGSLGLKHHVTYPLSLFAWFCGGGGGGGDMSGCGC